MEGPPPEEDMGTHRRVSKIVLEKSLEKGWKLAVRGTPKWRQNRTKDTQKSFRGMFWRFFGLDVEKTVIFRSPRTVKMRLPL